MDSKKKNEKQDEDEDKPVSVVIATSNPEKALYIVAKEAMVNHELEIHYTEKYAPTVEYLLRILRKSFGWMEIDREQKDVPNTKCLFNEKGYCTNPERLKLSDNHEQLRCTESIRMGCNLYKKKFNIRIKVNCVLIEKAGQIRNM
jgi:hypothetical protein